MLNKLAVISANDNDSYLFYLPIVAWAWGKLGWGVAVWLPNYNSDKSQFVLNKIKEALPYTALGHAPLPEIEGYRLETMAQVSRLYAANWFKYHDKGDTYILSSDGDMLPLSDYWKIPEDGKMACYGRNLSDRHQPICYCLGTVQQWSEMMELSGDTEKDMTKDLSGTLAKSDVWGEWFQVDQDIITTKLSTADVTNIDRPVSRVTGYPVGRVDRSAWGKSLLQDQFIDAHLPRLGFIKENFFKVFKLIMDKLNPTPAECQWILEYYLEYQKYIA